MKMPKVSRGPCRFRYSDDDLIAAVAAVKNGLSLRKATALYGVPSATLSDKRHQKYVGGKSRPGPTSLLTADHEEHLADWIVNMARIGYKVSKKEIPMLVKDILDAAEKAGEVISGQRKFPDNLPSSCWVYRFLNRYPVLASRVSETLENQKEHVTEQIISNWFEHISSFLLEEYEIDVKEFLNEDNGSRIFNVDESRFPLASTNGTLQPIIKKSAKNTYRMAPDVKEQITVLNCAAADGTLAKPYVIFPGDFPEFKFAEISTEHFYVGYAPKGWISVNCFLAWLTNLFLPSIQHKVKFPIILFMDRHTSHINYAVTQFCRLNKIILYFFPDHTTNIMQPLDISLYGPLKKYWNENLDKFSRAYNGLALSKDYFFQVFCEAWMSASNDTQNIKSGFSKSGLVPFNLDSVPCDIFVSNHPIEKLAPRSNIMIGERIGMMRIFQIFENNLPEVLRIMFERCYNEGFYHEDETYLGILWRSYKEMRTVAVDNMAMSAKEKSPLPESFIPVDVILEEIKPSCSAPF